jgi:phage terminase large subunit-like protein
MWDLSCPDWEERLRTGRSLIPNLPLIEKEASLGQRFFDELQLPDVPSKPRMEEACGQWFRDIVRASFGSWDPETQTRYIREILLLAPKGSSKTTNCAGLMLAVMLMNQRPRAEALFVGPTQAISDRAYEQAVGMIEESPDLKRRFRPRDHLKTIEDLLNKTEMKVKTFDVNILTGAILIFVLLDELHLLGRNAHTTKVLRQIRGGLDKTPEGQLLITTTQSDERPAGAFKEELLIARQIRDGLFRGKDIRPMLPVLYEFPASISASQDQFGDPANWPMVMPNLGRSVHLSTLIPDWNSEKAKGEHAQRIWLSQHLNLEIGTSVRSDGWAGAAFWERQTDKTLTFESLLERCEVVVIGIDGGGLDDLFGLTILGREKAETVVDAIEDGNHVKKRIKRWLSWSHAWCHRGVLERRKSIASVLQGFADADSPDLTIVDDELGDISGIVEYIGRVKDAGLLYCVAVDPAGLGEMVDALAEIDITQENKDCNFVLGVKQGYALMNAIKTTERKLANGTLLHAAQPIMDWCAGHVKIEQLPTAIRFTKQNAGDAKVDPVAALFDAAQVMSTNPEAVGSFGPDYQMPVWG